MGETLTRYWRTLVLGVCLMALYPISAGAGSSAQLFAVQLTANATKARIVLGLSQPAEFSTTVDGGRIAIDFAGLKLIPDPTVFKGLGLVRSYHAESLPGGGVSLIVDLTGPAVVTGSRTLPAEAGKPPRAVIELAAGGAPIVRPPASRTTVAEPQSQSPWPDDAAQPDAIAALIEQPGPHVLTPPAAATPKPRKSPAQTETDPPAHAESRTPPVVPVADIVSPAPPAKGKPASIASLASAKKTIVIDAGHGGIDPGADSVAGYHEKEITLATARLLRRVLEQTGRYKVILTRDSDVYLKLHERVTRARAAHGNLFISLHADSVQAGSDKTTRGASIYTLSETASDAESDRYAQRENRADAIGGVDLGDQRDDVAGILVDLTVRETVNDGNRLAGMMADSLEHGGIALLPNAPHRSAGFAVLKSPDIPSILIEMGYLSDLADARALADPRHQKAIANAVADGIDRYFAWVRDSRS